MAPSAASINHGTCLCQELNLSGQNAQGAGPKPHVSVHPWGWPATSAESALALAAYERAIALDPTFARAYNNLGAVVGEEGQPCPPGEDTARRRDLPGR
jgi:TPR repeat